MSGLLWVLGVLGYLAVGVGFARLWAWQVFRGGGDVDTYELRVEMVSLLFLWPVAVPLGALVALLRLALYPRRMR